MLALSLATVLEEALAVHKRLTGNVKRLEELFEPENLARLAELPDVAPLCAFLAFHPKVDTVVTDYVRAGTLADDSGPRLLVLFTLDTPAPVPVAIDGRSFGSWLEIEAGTHPAYQLVRLLFGTKPAPSLPGVVFFRLQDLPNEREAVYVPLGGAADEQDARTLLRDVFSLANRAADGKHPVDDLCVALRTRRIDYQRTGRMSMREWLLRGYQLAYENKGEIVSVVGLFG